MQVTDRSITVIMVVRNEEAFIAASLGSVLEQDYPSENIQILIVDGVSEDKTTEIVKEKCQTYPQSNCRILDNPQRVFPTGFNIGLKNATGEIVLMMGGHTVLQRDYLSQCVRYLQKYPDIDCVGGYLDTVANSEQGKVISSAMSSKFGVGSAPFRSMSNQLAEVDTVAFGAYRRRAVEYCGPMDEELVRDQDDEYNYRLREQGGKILITPDIHAQYYSRSSIRSLWKQYFEYGYWKVRVLQKHPFQMSPRQFVPPAFVLGLLFSGLLAFVPVLRPLSVILPLLYLLADITASVLTSARKGWKYLPLLPLVFLILHLSYGLGFLVGLVKFWNRWGDKVGKTPVWSGEASG